MWTPFCEKENLLETRKERKRKKERMFLGLDLSTQSLKGVVLNHDMDIVWEKTIVFGKDVDGRGSVSGVIQNGKEVLADVFVWIDAFDSLLSSLSLSGFSEKILAVCSAAQQHGSIYWKKGGNIRLGEADPSLPMTTNLENCFAFRLSPIWMDSSTKDECNLLEKEIGGPQALAELTGSRAFERFTASQIRKRATQSPEIFQEVERISLVSSFITSLFCGFIAPIDTADGSGMNIMNIQTQEWSKEVLAFLAREPSNLTEGFTWTETPETLKKKLGPLVPPTTSVGLISSFVSKRYNFLSKCLVIVGSGDNPCSMVGLGLGEGEAAVSLGTSDTMFILTKEPTPNPAANIFGSAIGKELYLGLLCFKNGSRTRETLKEQWTGEQSGWDQFNTILERTKPGNDGYLGLYFLSPEILPDGAQGIYLCHPDGTQLDSFDKIEMNCRALIESRFLSMLLHSRSLGLKSFSSILATGGASANPQILKIMSNVFGAPVYTCQETVNSAAVGAGIQAAFGALNPTDPKFTFQFLFEKRRTHQEGRRTKYEPDSEIHRLYIEDLLPRYAEFEEKVRKESQWKKA